MEDTAVGLMIVMTDLAYLETFGDEYMAQEFAEKRIKEDKQVQFNDNDLPPITAMEHQKVNPFLEQLALTDLSDRKELGQLKAEVLKALALAPDIPQLYDLLYHINGYLEDYDGAYEITRKGIERFPENYTARFFYGFNLLKIDRIEEAEELIWEAYDISGLPVGKDGLGMFICFILCVAKST